jgi:hypothetical protein
MNIPARSHLRVQNLVIPAVFIVSMVAAAMISFDMLFEVLLLIGGISLALWTLRKPNTRFLVLFASGFSSFALRSIPISMIVLAGIVGLWVADHIIHKKPFHISDSRGLRLALMFGLAAILSFLAGQIPWFPVPDASIQVQLAALGVFLFSMVIFFVGAELVGDERHLKYYLFLFFAISAGIILGLSLPVVRSVFARFFELANGGSMLGIWLAVIGFSQALVNTDLKPRYRWAIFGVTALYLIGTMITRRSWLSGWLPAIVGCIVVFWFHRPRFRVPILGTGLVAAILLWRLIGPELLAENAYSLTTRLAALENLIDIIRVNPLLGTGPANYYWYATLYPLLGFQVQFNSHNQYVDILLQVGLIGLILFFWLLIEQLRLAIKLFNMKTSKFAQAYSLSVIGGIAGMILAGFLADWLIPFFYNVGMRGFGGSMIGWFFLGGLVLLERIYVSNKS